MSTRSHDRLLARWLWQAHARRWLPILSVAFVCMVLDGAMAGALSLLLQPMFDEVLVGRRGDLIGWIAAAIAATFVVRALSSFVFRTILSHVGEKIVAAMQGQLTAHLLTLDHRFHHDHPPGHLIDRVRGDTTDLALVFERVATVGVRDTVMILALIGAALWTDWVWTLVTLVGVPLLVLPAALLQRLVRRMNTRAREASAEASTRLDEVFHGVVTIQRGGLEAREGARLAETLGRFVKARVRTAAGQAAMVSMSDLVAALGFALVLMLAGGQIVAGTRSVGDFMSFLTAIALLFEPMRRLGALSGAWSAALASLERIYALLDHRATVSQPADALPAIGSGDIVFDDVRFAYGEDPVLQGLSLTAKAGQTTALVGPSGAGKSTIFALLTRLADPQGGRITLGGQDIRDTDLAGLRGLFAVVAQDSALFDETLRDNILLGAGPEAEARLDAAVEAAQVGAFLDQLPQGLDTRAGPRGSALSGGQRQRVALARALVRAAPILLLDEATSALDAKSEAAVQAALDQHAAGRTTLVIAHRLATIRNADQILVVEAGRVTETGTHDSLLALGGTYARLHALQSGTGDAG